MSDNIFKEQTPVSNVNNEPVQNTFNDLLNDIQNEQGQPKYRDVPTALNALKHSQEFISQMKAEKEKLEKELEIARGEVSKISSLEEAVLKLTSKQTTQEAIPAKVVSEEVVANLVNETISRRETEAIQKTNLSKVVESVQKAFGDQAEKVFYDKAEELGLSKEEINSLAAKSPTAVLKMFNIGEKSQTNKTFSPNTTSVNTAGLTPNQQTFVSKNDKSALIGATTSELQAERENSKKLVEELHNQGLSVHDLTDPKVYFKHFQ